MALTKCFINKKADGRYRYRDTTNVLSSLSSTQPTATDIGINPTSGDSYRLTQRLNRKKTTGGSASYYVKREKFVYDLQGDPKKVITTYHETGADYKLSGHAADASLESAFNGATQQTITETHTNAHAVISDELATTTNWNTTGLPAGYGGDTTATNSALAAGGNETDFNSVLIKAPTA